MSTAMDTGDSTSMPRPKVFGIGLGRTGTTSLTQALSMLGYQPNHLPADEVTQREMYAYFSENPHTTEPLKLSILNEHDALTDTPVCCVFQGLDRAYPGSRFILTVRDKETWLASYERLWQQILVPFFTENATAPDVQYLNFLTKTLVARALGDEAAQIFDGEFPGVAYYDRDTFSRLYDAYHDDVHAYFAGRSDQLLVMNVVGGEGWEKLAPFLGSPAPVEPFPFEMRLTRRESAAGSLSSAELTAIDEQDRERKILKVQEYLDAFQRHDLSSCLDFYADDAVLKFFDKRYEGRPGIEKWHRDRFAAQVSLVSIDGFDATEDTVMADLTIKAKFLRRLSVKGSGRAVLRLDNEKIKEVGFESVRLLR